MATLMLADNPYSHLADPSELYIFIPQGYRGSERNMRVREDMFDNLPEPIYQQMMMELAPYQSTGLSELADKAARQARKEKRKQKKAGKQDKKDMRAKKRASRQSMVMAKNASKQAAFERGETPMGQIFGGIKDITSNIFGGNQGGGGAAAAADEMMYPTERDFSVDIDTGEDDQPTFWDQYKMPIIMGGVALAAGAVYLATRKK